LGDIKVSRDIFGIVIQDDSEYLVDLLERLLTFRRIGDTKVSEEDKQKNQPYFQTSCQKVLCAMKDPKIFGPDLGPRVLYLLGRFGLNASPYATFNSDQWTPPELDDVLTAIEDYPPSVFPISESKQLTHFKRGMSMGKRYDPGNAIIANAMIFFFDAWSQQSAGRRQMETLHELAHFIATQYSLDRNPIWNGFSGWHTEKATIEGRIYDKDISDRSDNIVSEYGQSSPWEDFAESVMAYRSNPQHLLRISSEKYQYIKEAVFDGLEYTSEDFCRFSTQSTSRTLQEDVRQNAAAFSNNPKSFSECLVEVESVCGERLFRQFMPQRTFDFQRLSRADDCIEKEVAACIARDSKTMQKLHYPAATQAITLDRIRTGVPQAVLHQFKYRVQRDLVQSFSAMIKELDIRAAGAYSKHKELTGTDLRTQIASFCPVFAAYPDQAANHIGMTLRFGKDNLFAYKFQDLLSQFAMDACIEIQNQHTTLSPMTPVEVEAAVKRKFALPSK